METQWDKHVWIDRDAPLECGAGCRSAAPRFESGTRRAAIQNILKRCGDAPQSKSYQSGERLAALQKRTQSITPTLNIKTLDLIPSILFSHV